MAEIKWQRGNFLRFVSQMKIQIGAQKGLSIQAHDDFEFDGSILKYGGLEVNTVELRGAIKDNWATLADSDSESTAPECSVPMRKIAKAQTINTDLSKVQRSDSRSLESSIPDEDTVMRVDDRRPKNNSSRVLGVNIDNSSPRTLTKDSIRSSMPISSNVDDQEGVSIGRVRTPTRLSSDVTKDVGLADKLTNLSGSGFIRDKTIEKEGVTIRTNVGKMDPNVGTNDDEEGVVIGKVRHSRNASTEGIEVKDTSNINTRTASKKVKIDVNLSPRIRIARSIYPSFPVDWSFDGKLAERYQRAKDYGISDEFLQALYAAEGDQFRSFLTKQHPKLFG